MDNRRKATMWIVKVAMLSAVAAILMFLEIPVPLVPPFLKFDFSDIPALLAGFSLGPLAGVAVMFVKNIIHALTSWSFFVGELANFLIGVSFVLPAAIIYKRNKNKKSAVLGMIAGGIIMTIFAGFLNYFLLIPLYTKVLGYTIEEIIAWSSSANKGIIDLKSLIIIGITPFNVFKAFINILVTTLIYKKLSPLLHEKKSRNTAGADVSNDSPDNTGIQK